MGREQGHKCSSSLELSEQQEPGAKSLKALDEDAVNCSRDRGITVAEDAPQERWESLG